MGNALKGKGCESAITTSSSQAMTEKTAKVPPREETPGGHRLEKPQHSGFPRHQHPGRTLPKTLNMKWSGAATLRERDGGMLVTGDISRSEKKIKCVYLIIAQVAHLKLQVYCNCTLGRWMDCLIASKVKE